MPSDLTAILFPKGQLTDDEARALVLARNYGDVFVRVAPLDAVGLVQVEVHHARDGLPCEDPELVGQIAAAAAGGRASYVHVNHTAKQALVHRFDASGPRPGFAGAPGAEFDQQLAESVGATLEAITAADDGTRFGIGVASSRTVALARGRTLLVPTGTPTDLNSFAFHDRGAGLDEDDQRMALFAFDAAEARRRFSSTPGRELAAQLSVARELGPLAGARARVVEALAALGDRAAGEALRDVRALELVALDEARVFGGGDGVSYWDERVLPLFALSGGEPVVGADDVDDLDECASVLHALVDVMPYAAPPGGEGSMLASIADSELGPLAPWARAGEEYSGTLFTLDTARLLGPVRALTGPKLGTLIQTLERAWYRAARPGLPEGDALETFRRAKADEGAADVERCLRDWAELRVVLELAAANQWQVAVIFYEGAA